jgi:membrane protease YdiL (CAAX protease family)
MYLPFKAHLKNFDAPVHRITGASHGLSLWVIALFTIFGAPFFEELFFRGLLYRGLEAVIASPARRITVTAVLAILADGVLFGAAHLEWVQFAGLAVVGVLLAVMFRITGRLGMSMVGHATFNAVAMISLVTTGTLGVHW